jgi:tetratricopeptide (TPR) repeat protein
MSVKMPKRDIYTVRTLLTDLKKLKLTPNSLYLVGSEVVYHEWQQAKENLGQDNDVTTYLGELLSFMQKDYEVRLLEGDFHREDDTLMATLTNYLKDTPSEFQSYTLELPGEVIRGVLKTVRTQSERDIKRYERIEGILRSRIETDPSNPDTWNELRITLWILGKYEEASKAFKKAKKLGWDKGRSKIVGV